jgi:hypothetical protein
MKTTTIKINDTDIVLKFGYGFLRILASFWGLNGPAAVMGKFLDAARPLVELYAQMVDDPAFEQKVTTGESKEVPFESLDVFVDVIVAAAKNQDVKTADWLTADDVADFLFNSPETMAAVTSLFIESMPRPKTVPEGKPNPAIVPAP